MAQRAHEQRLRHPGNALQHDVTSGQQGDQQPGDGPILTDDGSADLGAYLREGVTEFCRHGYLLLCRPVVEGRRMRNKRF